MFIAHHATSPGMYTISGTTPYSRPTLTRAKPKSGEVFPKANGLPAVIARSSKLSDMNSALRFSMSGIAPVVPRAPSQIPTRRPSKLGLSKSWAMTKTASPQQWRTSDYERIHNTRGRIPTRPHRCYTKRPRILNTVGHPDSHSAPPGRRLGKSA